MICVSCPSCRYFLYLFCMRDLKGRLVPGGLYLAGLHDSFHGNHVLLFPNPFSHGILPRVCCTPHTEHGRPNWLWLSRINLSTLPWQKIKSAELTAKSLRPCHRRMVYGEVVRFNPDLLYWQRVDNNFAFDSLRHCICSH